MANRQIWEIRDPPGVHSIADIPRVAITAPNAQNIQDFFGIVQNARRAFPMGRLFQVNLKANTFRGQGRFNIPVDVFASVQTLDQFLNALATPDENGVGSANLIQEGQPLPIPDFTTFELIFVGVNANDLQRVNPVAAVAFAPRLPRFNALNLGLQGNIRYGANKTPWLVEAADGSHDPSFEDDKRCLYRVSEALGLEPPPPGLTTPDKCLTWLKETFFAAHGKKLCILPIKYLHKVFEYGVESTKVGLDMYIPKQKNIPRKLYPVTQENVMPINNEDVYVLYDGDSHVAMPRYVEDALGNRYFKVVPGFLHHSGNFYRARGEEGLASLEDAFHQANINPVLRNHELNDGFKVVASWDLDRQYRMEIRAKRKTQDKKFGYLFFDFETVVTPEGEVVPYAVSWLFVSVKLEQGKFVPIFPESPKDYVAHTHFHFGPDSAEKLAAAILKSSYQRVGDHEVYDEVVGVTFNGASFDNFLLYNTFLSKKKHDLFVEDFGEFNVNRVFWQGSSLAQMYIDGHFCLFDLRKHLTGSLAKNCKNFDTGNRKIGDFNHEAVQRVYARLGMDGLRDYAGPELLPEGKTPEDYPEEDFPRFMTKLEEYAKMDSAALAELFFKYRDLNLLGPQTELCPPLTLASESYRSWTKMIKGVAQGKPGIPNLFPEQDDEAGQARLKRHKETHSAYLWKNEDLARLKEYRETSIVGGRTQLFHPPDYVQEDFVSMDVKSLYPYVMCVKDVYYPWGVYIDMEDDPKTLSEFFHMTDKLGMWYVDVNQSSLANRDPPLPPIIAAKIDSDEDAFYEKFDLPRPILERNNWHSPDSSRIWLTTEEVQTLFDYGCEVYFMKARIWQHKIKSTELFGNLAKLMKVKNEQDRAKLDMEAVLEREDGNKQHPDYVEAKSRYNAALRQAAKLASNALYGKMMEGFHLDSMIEVDRRKMEKIIENIHHGVGRYLKASTVHFIQNKAFLKVKGNPLWSGYETKQHPMVIGFYILAYARMYMYKEAYARLGIPNLYYTDTDCVKTTRAAFEKYLKPVWSTTPIPHWPEAEEFEPLYATNHIFEEKCKCYGGFENELEANGGLVTIAKKTWLIVPPGTGPLITSHPDDLNPDHATYVKIDPSDPSVHCGMKGIGKSDILLTTAQGELLTSGFFTVGSNDWKELCESLFSDKSRSIQNTYGELYGRLLHFQEAYVLRSNFIKNVTQMRDSVAWGDTDNHVQNFSALTHAFSVAILRPSKSQEVPDVYPESLVLG